MVGYETAQDDRKAATNKLGPSIRQYFVVPQK